MSLRTYQRSLWLATLLVVASVFPRLADATIVQFQTVMGNFEVNLYDNATPQTVSNFLNYVNNGAYSNSVIHRAEPDFVVQGGGLGFDLAWPLDAIPANAPVVNEPEFSSVRGTIAMAKLGGDPNSATNQWFFNLANNSANLDVQNGGFTVFGEVVGNGMDVVDAIAALPRHDLGGSLAELPLRGFAGGVGVTPDASHLVIVTSVIVTDTTVDSAAGLNPPVNTLIQAPPPAPAPQVNNGGGGGSFSLLLLFGLLLGYRARLR